MKLRTSSARINDLLLKLMRDGDVRRFLVDPRDMSSSIQVCELIDLLEEVEERRERDPQ